METTNVSQWAMCSRVQEIVDIYNMGFITRAELANHCYVARAPYIGKFKNCLLWIRDRWF